MGGRGPALIARGASLGLSRIVDDLKREPPRTGSLVVTVFGDAIVPRGGSVWLGTLLDFFTALEIDGGGVRTAMSRLASDGWLERRKVGRNSFYRLAEKGRARFDAAMRHVYDPAPSGPLELLLLANGAAAGAKAAFRTAGFGSPLPGIWLAPAGAPNVVEAKDAIRVAIDATADDARRLVAASWDFGAMADAYRQFIATFQPLQQSLVRGPEPSEVEAFVARILVVNSYRRVSLRDPLLPKNLLPADWPGELARALCRETYRALLPASERWLDRHGSNETGPLPAAEPGLARRFDG